MRILKVVLFGGMILGLMALPTAFGHWVTKDGFIDYAQHQSGQPPQEWPFDGMPDFDQKQNGWFNVNGQWNWCGPVAAANCLWWFDSKFEMIKCKSLPPGTLIRPLTISDHYTLVHNTVAAVNQDDHDPLNLVPWITLFGSQPPGVGMQGITAQQMKTMIENYLALPAVDLWGHYNIRIIGSPTFEQIYQEIEVSQDVILLLGFWQYGQNGWYRFGGHWLTVAGVDSQNSQQWMSLCDPMSNNAEAANAGVVWNGWITPHMFPPPHGFAVHNDAGNVSHDWYRILVSNSPGGGISPEAYGEDFDYETWQNFQGLNVPDHLQGFQGVYNPALPVHCEEEGIVVICPNFDYGDLHQDYPTIDVVSCGPAHPLTDKAWLGESVDSEIQPKIYNNDLCDDGVQFIGLGWWPGTQVSVDVTITTGAHYAGESLFLSAWKDGNIDGDFDDGPDNPSYNPSEEDYLQCSEWVIQDVQIDPPPAGSSYTLRFTFCDPGVFDLGPYELRMRFRLNSQAVGRYGYGGYWGGGVSNGRGTYDIDWVLGEVEDYALAESQLPVELKSFNAVPYDGMVDLQWVTASESDNSYFTVARRTGTNVWADIARVNSRGSSATDQQYSYRDADLTNGTTYEYRLAATDLAGHTEILAVDEAIPMAGLVPLEYALMQNRPNPFNANTEIEYSLRENGYVTLTIYNAVGQQVATLVDGYQTADRYQVAFDASALASGIYLYRLTVNDFTAVKKMVLMK